MTAATALSKTRKPRTTPANLIAAEFATRRTPEPAAAPVPAPSQSPIVLIFWIAVIAIALFKVAAKVIALLLPVVKAIVSQAAKFVDAQRGGRVIDFRVYDPIFG